MCVLWFQAQVPIHVLETLYSLGHRSPQPCIIRFTEARLVCIGTLSELETVSNRGSSVPVIVRCQDMTTILGQMKLIFASHKVKLGKLKFSPKLPHLKTVESRLDNLT